MKLNFDENIFDFCCSVLDNPKCLAKKSNSFHEVVTKKGSEGTIDMLGRIKKVTKARIPNVIVNRWLPNESESNSSEEKVPLNVFLTSLISEDITGILD